MSEKEAAELAKENEGECTDLVVEQFTEQVASWYPAVVMGDGYDCMQ